MVQIKRNTALNAKKEKKKGHVNNMRNHNHHHNPRINFYEAQTFAPQAYTVQTFAHPTFALRASVPQKFEPQNLQTFAPQTFTSHPFAIQMNALRAMAPQSIMLRAIVPQTIAPRTAIPQTFAPQTPAPSTSTCSRIITPQQLHAIQQNQLQSRKLVQKSQVTSRSLTSIWTYTPELLPRNCTFLPVTIFTPWYGANWEITDPYDMNEIYTKTRRARDPFSYVKANTMHRSNTATHQSSAKSLKSLWEDPIEAYTPHQSKTSETLLREQLISEDPSNLNINELIRTAQMG